MTPPHTHTHALNTHARPLPHPQAAVDVIASSGWLSPALAAMEMSQMATQALWERDSPLLQLPGVGPELAAAAAAKEVEGVFGLIDLEEEERRELLQVGPWRPAFFTALPLRCSREEGAAAAAGVEWVLNAAL